MNTTRLKALAEWLVSTDTDQATDEELAEAVTYDGVEYTTDSVEYRLAKFSAELADHFVEDAVIFYYLFTEMFLSIDQREKNAFPTYLADVGKWIVLFYDADSSCGTDNKGNLAFDYYLEDIDYTEGGEPIYNGQNSVLWKNLRATRYDAIQAMYDDLRVSNAVSYDSVNGAFENHQSKWPEAIFNEDMHTKCIEPLILDGDGEYLPMLKGKKEQWMKWWLYNRFRYLDSKYETGTSKTNYIKIRSRAKGNVKLTAYVNMYGHVYYNSERVEYRMNRGEEKEFVWAASGAEDAVIGIYDGDMITSMGDLAPLIAEEVNVSVATHLTSLKVGDASDDYRNYSLKTLTLGNNKLLRTLDVRNCPNLDQSPNLSGCTNIEEAYFDGTSIPGLTLPNGGILKKLHLPGTIKNLTLLNQASLAEFVIPSYSQIETLRLENNSSVIDPFAILEQIADNSRVRIIGFDRTMTEAELKAFLDKLYTMRGLDENGNTIQGEDGNNEGCAQVSGRIYVEMINGSLLKRAEKYVGLNVEYGSSYLVSTRLVERTLSGEYVNDRVTSVGQCAFVECDSLNGISLPNAANVEREAFRNCDNLTKVNISKAAVLNQSTFTRCYKLVDIDMSSVTTVYGWENFVDDGALEVLDWPAVTRIENSRMLIGSGVKAIFLRNTAKVCSVYASEGMGMLFGSTCYIYVPKTMDDGADGIASYEAATNWSNIAGRFRYIEDYTVDGTLDGEIDLTKI